MTTSTELVSSAGVLATLGAGIGERLGLFGRAIPHGQRVADLHQPRADVRAHVADAGDADVHSTLLPTPPTTASYFIRSLILSSAATAQS